MRYQNIIDVAIPSAICQTFYYNHNEPLEPGSRVRVKFGRRDLLGITVGCYRPEKCSFDFELHDIIDVLDKKPALSATLLHLCKWLSIYYFCPLGEVLRTAASGYPSNFSDPVEPPKVKPQGAFPLMPEQKQSLEEFWRLCLAPSLGGNQTKPFLLKGVTGSGKTEIYLHAIAEALEQSPRSQILMMVPEISLTPQIFDQYDRRFPGAVAMVHSALAPKVRAQQLDEISSGAKSILIGPRSAVFAPFRNLKMIVVDEEHDASYKQGSKPHYHGRDVAIYRGLVEKAAVLMGSATPSMESTQNAAVGKFHKFVLHQRVNKAPLPNIQISAPLPPKPYLISAEATALGDAKDPLPDEIYEAIAQTLADKAQVIVIVNRRGYAGYLLSENDSKALTCPSCSISLSFHSDRAQLLCHYCGYRRSPGSNSLLARGYGSQKTEAFLKRRFPEAKISRVDSDSTSKKGSLNRILEDFRAQNTQILVGTQMLAKGHDFPRVALTVVLEVDQMLNMPDFRAGERTFQLIVQAAGRTGRGNITGRVLLQTRHPNHPLIRAAVQHDHDSFINFETAIRRQIKYPPFSHMVSVELSAISSSSVEKYAFIFAKHLMAQFQNVPDHAHFRILGPTPPPIQVINRRTRLMIVIIALSRSKLHEFLGKALTTHPKPPASVRISVDVDPQSLV